jgi:hypothetical protein
MGNRGRARHPPSRYTKDHPSALYEGCCPSSSCGKTSYTGKKLNPVGRSDKAIAPLWDGSKIIGEIVADNLLSPGTPG